MPSASTGFTGTEIVAHITQYLGDESSATEDWIENCLALAEFRFCKLADWKFLHKSGMTLTKVAGTSVYSTSALTDGATTRKVKAKDIKVIYDKTNDVELQKVDIRKLRNFDPNKDDGSATDYPTVWAVNGDYSIEFYPPSFANGTLYIDAKITPDALTTMSNYPTIPYEYQESFIEYVKALALDYADDDRAQSAKQNAIALIKADIAENDTEADEENYIKHPDEVRTRGVSYQDLDKILWLF